MLTCPSLCSYLCGRHGRGYFQAQGPHRNHAPPGLRAHRVTNTKTQHTHYRSSGFCSLLHLARCRSRHNYQRSTITCLITDYRPPACLLVVRLCVRHALTRPLVSCFALAACSLDDEKKKLEAKIAAVAAEVRFGLPSCLMLHVGAFL